MIKQQRYSILNQQFIHVYFGSTHSVNSNKFIIAIFSLLVCMGLIITISCRQPAEENSLLNLDVINVNISEITIITEVAFSPEEKAKGLSGRKDLPDGKGMLFYYSDSRPTAFWMKGMLFAIDIIWIGEDCTILDIDNDLSPPTSHNSELTIYSAPKLARSVLELKSGQAKSLGLNIDDKVTFEAKDINKYTLCRE